MEIQTRFDKDKVRFDQENDVHLVIGLKAPKLDWQAKRPPICLIPVIDISGSMAGDKIHYAKQSVIKLIEHLQPGDYCGLVTFASNVQLVAPPTEMTQSRKADLQAKVGALGTYDLTNFSGGMLLGLEQANKAEIPEGLIRRVIMFTDGCANQGIATDRAGLCKLLDGSRDKASVSCFGYGDDADQELLADLAKRGQGNYAFIRNPEDALGAFAKELGGLLSTYAQSIVADVAMHNGHELVEVVSDVDSQEVEPKKRIKVTIPNIYSEELRNIVIKLRLAKQNQALPRLTVAADVKVEYQVLGANGKIEHHENEAKAKVQFVKPGEEQDKPDHEVDEIVGRAQLVQKQIEAEKQVKAGNYDAAQGILRACSDDLHARGFDKMSFAANKLMGMAQNEIAYKTGGGYWNSSKAVGSRAYGASSADVSYLADIGERCFTNQAQDDLIKSFKGGADPADPADPAAPADPADPVGWSMDVSGVAVGSTGVKEAFEKAMKEAQKPRHPRLTKSRSRW